MSLLYMLIKTNMKNLKLILKSLINNEACVEGGRHRPWWIAIIIFFLSMIISIIPVFVQTFTKSGAEFISSTTYGYEVGAQRFIEDASDKGLSMVVRELDDGTKYLDLEQENWNAIYTYEDHYGYHAYQHKDANDKVDFEVFYVSDFTNSVISNIASDAEVVNSETEEVSYTKRSTSFIVFGKFELVSYAYNGASTNSVGSVYGDYKSFEKGFNILSIENVIIGEETYNHNTITAEQYKPYQEGVWKNLKQFFHDSYLYNRGQLTWRTVLLMFGINAVLTIFMGFMIWVLTRGKANPFRIYTIFECQLISAWCTLSPAILTIALGFLISGFSQIMFPLLLGLRVMWLSMKTLKPEYTTAPQQKKEVKTVDTKPAKGKK